LPKTQNYCIIYGKFTQYPLGLAQDKRIEIFVLLFWAHPCACGAWTGLSALQSLARSLRAPFFSYAAAANR
jgi:hypothetical protein